MFSEIGDIKKRGNLRQGGWSYWAIQVEKTCMQKKTGVKHLGANIRRLLKLWAF